LIERQVEIGEQRLPSGKVRETLSSVRIDVFVMHNSTHAATSPVVAGA